MAQLMVRPGVGFLRALVRPPRVRGGLTEREGTAFADALRARLHERPAPLSDPWTLLAAASLMIAEVQGRQTATAPLVLAAEKGRLYRLRTAALFFAQWRDRSAVDLVLGPDPAPVGAVAQILRPGPTPNNLGDVFVSTGPEEQREKDFWVALAEIDTVWRTRS